MMPPTRLLVQKFNYFHVIAKKSTPYAIVQILIFRQIISTIVLIRRIFYEKICIKYSYFHEIPSYSFSTESKSFLEGKIKFK